MNDEIDPVDVLASAVREVWEQAEGPEALWGLQFIVANSSDDNDVRSMYGPLFFPNYDHAHGLAHLVNEHPEIIDQWTVWGWLVPPDADHRWMTLAMKVVQVAPVPF